MLVEAAGELGPDEVWSRFTTPAAWPSWAPQIRGVSTADTVLTPGGVGRVHGPGPLAVDYEITEVDAELRTWSWQVGRAGPRVLMRHVVLPTASGGSRALLQVDGPTAVLAQAYRPLARAALRRLVSPPDETPAATSAPTPGGQVEPVHEFGFAFDPGHAAAARPFGITEATSSVEVGPRWLYVRYGPWKLLTPRTNVGAAHLSSDFSFARTAGPPRLSLRDRGVTMAGNGDRAVCLEFARPVSAIDTTGLLRHPGATLTVADPEGLVAALGLRS